MNYTEMPGRDLAAAYLSGDHNAEAVIRSRSHDWVQGWVSGYVGHPETTDVIVAIAFERGLAKLAEFDASKTTLEQFIVWQVFDIMTQWETPARLAFNRIWDEIDAADRSKLYHEIESSIKAAMRQLILGDEMIAIAKRLIEAGHDVWEAGKFAALKLDRPELKIRWTPDADRPVNELMVAINAESDPVKLESLWGFIFDACYVDDEFDYESFDDAAA